MHFFCNEEHASQWKAERPEEEGFLIDFEQSARICKIFYGNLRASLATES